MKKQPSKTLLKLKYKYPPTDLIWIAITCTLVIVNDMVGVKGKILLLAIYIIYSSLLVIYPYQNQTANTLMIKTSIFNKRIKWLYQSVNKKKIKGCPQQLFKQEVSEIISELPTGTTYRMITHESILRLIRQTTEYKNGQLEIYQTESFYKKELSNIEKKLRCKQCKSCDNLKCPIKNKKKRRRDFYGVDITKTDAVVRNL